MMKQTRITKYFSPIYTEKKIIHVKDDKIEWKCLECGIDMGDMNPRQLCGKTKCLFNTDYASGG